MLLRALTRHRPLRFYPLCRGVVSCAKDAPRDRRPAAFLPPFAAMASPRVRLSMDGAVEEKHIADSSDAHALDREAFTTLKKLLAARIPVKSIGAIMSACKKAARSSNDGEGLVFARRGVSCIASDPAAEDAAHPATKLLLFRECFSDASQLPEQVQTLLRESGATFVEHQIPVTYDHLSAEEVLRIVLPREVEVPSSFETIGHIAHLNLRDNQLPFKHVIGQVILDKNPAIKTVVTKVGTIQNQYRVFAMETIAGENRLEVQTKENDCRFCFDFSKVYWNSRLQTEHRRIIDSLRPQDVVCDMFCGVGPFALPAAKKGCIVYANDLNPDSYRYLVANAQLNKVTSHVHACNMDARDFFRHVRHGQDAGTVPAFTCILMNLPAMALDFLDVLRGCYSTDNVPAALPTVHCYCFAPPENAHETILKRAQQALGSPLSSESVQIRWVRNVAPNKDMFCLSFSLPEDIATASAPPDPSESQCAKRPRRE